MKWWAVLAGALAVSWWLSSQPGDQLPPVGWWNGDKLVHAAVWAVLAALAAAGGRARGWPPRTFALAAIGFGLGYGVVDEWHQSYVPMRDSSVADVIADLVGATAGALLITRVGSRPPERR